MLRRLPAMAFATPLPRRWASRALVLSALAAAYFVAGRFGLHYAHVHESASPVWPPTGLSIAAVLLLGPWVWPAVFVGAFLTNVATAASVPTSLGIAAGNTLEALLAGHLVTRFAGGPAAFERARDVFAFVGLAGFLSTVVSASIGVASLLAGGFASLAEAPRIWWTWWLGDLAGALVVTPALVLWARTRPVGFGGRGAEAALLFAATGLIGFVAFGPLGTGGSLSFACLPPLAWAAFRLRPREVATGIVLLSGIAVSGTAAGIGTFHRGNPNESLLMLETFMATISMTMLPLAAVVAENRLASRAKDEFLAMLSHELRTPLAAITNAVAVLEARDRAEPRVVSQATAILARQVRHLARLVDDLLDVSRLATAGISLQRRPTDLARTVADAVLALRSAGKLDAHRLSVETRPAWVDADPVRLEQVVTNLLSNAVQNTPAGGHVKVGTERTGALAVLRVEDDGVGMRAETLPRVFELFFQARGSPSRPVGGLGLGLNLVRRLVELHGGSVQASSAGPGRGASFVVRLPAIPPPALAQARAEGAPHVSGRRSVLVVEDNTDVRESLVVVLQQAGYSVTCADDGPKGVEAALATRPEVMLVDLGLPGFDGHEVARRVRAAPEGSAILLVALTGYGQEQDRTRTREAGFDLHLVKPLDPARLVALLAEASRLREP